MRRAARGAVLVPVLVLVRVVWSVLVLAAPALVLAGSAFFLGAFGTRTWAVLGALFTLVRVPVLRAGVVVLVLVLLDVVAFRSVLAFLSCAPCLVSACLMGVLSLLPLVRSFAVCAVRTCAVLGVVLTTVTEEEGAAAAAAARKEARRRTMAGGDHGGAAITI